MDLHNTGKRVTGAKDPIGMMMLSCPSQWIQQVQLQHLINQLWKIQILERQTWPQMNVCISGLFLKFLMADESDQ